MARVHWVTKTGDYPGSKRPCSLPSRPHMMCQHWVGPQQQTATLPPRYKIVVMVKRQGRNVVVLLSGGADSAALLSLYKEDAFRVRAVHVQYGQLAAAREFAAASRIAKHYDVPLKTVRCTGFMKFREGLLLGRNAFLLMAAVLAVDQTPSLVALGVHRGSRYYDCSPGFIKAMQRVLDGYTDGALRVAAPFLAWEKAQIWAFCRRYDVPVDQTYSCERGLKRPCGRCLSCKDLERLRAG